MSHDHSHSHGHGESCGVACSHSFPGASSRVNERIQESLQESQRRIAQLQQRLKRQQQEHSKGGAKEEAEAAWAADWARRYERWAGWDWESEEELASRLREEQRTLERIQQRQQLTPHQHDHTIEREIFELPDEEKLRLCEKSRTLGNYLFSEGQFIRALEQYQLGVSYYEYCFPDDENMQKRLDEVKQMCLLNSALCNLRLKRFRNAINCCDQVLHEDTQNVKALFRRATAYRNLGEFELAKQDLDTALRIEPGAANVAKELQTLQLQKAAYDEKTANVSKKMFSAGAQKQASSTAAADQSKLRAPGLLDSAFEEGLRVPITDPAQPMVPEDDFDALAREVDDAMSQLGTFTLADFVHSIPVDSTSS